MQLYLPARFRRSRQYPLVVVHDGKDYLNYAGMKEVLDNLIHRLEIPDVIVAFTDSPDRLREYPRSFRHHGSRCHMKSATQRSAMSVATVPPVSALG